MQPGLSRAVPIGILGFVSGALLVVIIRGLQSMDPLWDPELGLVSAGFLASFAFVWGMGALNPSVNAHAHEPETDETGLIIADEHDTHQEEDEAPETVLNVLGYSIWQIAFWTIVLMVVLFAFASLEGGFALQISSTVEAQTEEIGYYTIDLPFGGPTEVKVSQFWVFMLLGATALVSMVVVAGGMAMAFMSLGANVKAYKAADPIPLGTYRAEIPTENKAMAGLTKKSTLWEIAKNGIMRALPFAFVFGVIFYALDKIMQNAEIVDSPRLLTVLTEWVSTLPPWMASIFALILALIISNVLLYNYYNSRGDLEALRKTTLAMGLTFILYWVFYYILLWYAVLGIARIAGLGDTPPEGLMTPLSAINAIGIVVPVLFSWFALRTLSRFAKGLANWLRGAPEFLGQK